MYRGLYDILALTHLYLNTTAAISQTTFLNAFYGWTILYFDSNLTESFVSKGPIGNTSVLVQVMAWRRTGDKPLSEPMMTQFTDAYMRHQGKISRFDFENTTFCRMLSDKKISVVILTSLCWDSIWYWYCLHKHRPPLVNEVVRDTLAPKIGTRAPATTKWTRWNYRFRNDDIFKLLQLLNKLVKRDMKVGKPHVSLLMTG